MEISSAAFQSAKMKKAIVIIVALILTLLFAACGNSSGKKSASTSGGSAPAKSSSGTSPASGAAGGGTATVSGTGVGNTAAAAEMPTITLPPGWEKKSGNTYVLTEKTNPGAGSSLAVISTPAPAGVKNPSDFANHYQNTLKTMSIFKEAQFGPTSNVTVGGMSGIQYTCATGLAKFMYTHLPYKDNVYYTIQCTAIGNSYDKVASDFKSMINSFKLK